jgi:glycosyltransferase involved in cell wall biosynthesis
LHYALSLGTQFQDVRILIVTPRFYPLVGGQEVQAEMLAKLLVRNGGITTVLTERFKENHIGRDKHFDFTVLHLENQWNFPLPRLRMFFKSLAFYFYHSNEFDLIIVRTFSLHSLALGFYKRLMRPSLCSIILTDSVTEVPAVTRSKFSLLLKYFFCGNNFINAISSDVNSQLKELMIDPEKIKHIPNLVEVANVPDFVTIRGPSKKFVYIGNIVREKGVFDLVKSFSTAVEECPDISLDIYGLGRDEEQLSKLVRHLKLEGAIKFHGTMPNDEIVTLLSKFHCLIYPSHQEGFGLVPFEAAAVPIRIIATRVGELEKYLSNRCMFVQSGDEQELTSAIQCVSKNDIAPVILSNVEWKVSLSHESILYQLYSLLDTKKSIKD